MTNKQAGNKKARSRIQKTKQQYKTKVKLESRGEQIRNRRRTQRMGNRYMYAGDAGGKQTSKQKVRENTC